MLRYELLQAIADQIGAKRFLELGVQSGNTYHRVRVPFKVGVDPDVSSAATVYQTSDNYFAGLRRDERFDLIFVDGLHTEEQAKKDIGNAARFLAPGGAIVIHDCNPPDKSAAAPENHGGVWCGTVYRAWVAARREWRGLAAVVDTDLGCGVLSRRAALPAPHLPQGPFSWEDFAANRAGYLNLISVDQFLRSVLPRL